MPSQDPITRNGVSHGGQEGTSAWPGLLRHFADHLEEVRSAKILDMDQLGRVLVECTTMAMPLARVPAPTR